MHPYRREIASLLARIKRAGFKVRGVASDDGEPISGEPLDAILAVDESVLFLDTPDGKRAWVLIILGNSPGEAPADYSVNAELDRITSEHYKQWNV